MNFFKKTQMSLRLYMAIRKADKAHRKTGERYYVIPMTGSHGRLVVLDRKNFRLLKAKRYMNRHQYVGDLEEGCFYCTPYRDGSRQLSDEFIAHKRRQFFAWADSLKKRKNNIHDK